MEASWVPSGFTREAYSTVCASLSISRPRMDAKPCVKSATTFWRSLRKVAVTLAEGAVWAKAGAEKRQAPRRAVKRWHFINGSDISGQNTVEINNFSSFI